VWKKLPGIRLVPIELEVGGEATAEAAKAFQQLFASGLARDAELSSLRDVDFDLVAFLEAERAAIPGIAPRISLRSCGLQICS
jgi:hypothetical protein